MLRDAPKLTHVRLLGSEMLLCGSGAAKTKSLTWPLQKARLPRKDLPQASATVVLRTLCEVLDLTGCTVFFFTRERPVVVYATGLVSKLPHVFDGSSNRRICFDKRLLLYCNPHGSVVKHRLRDLENNRLESCELPLQQFQAADIRLTRAGELLALSKSGTLAIGDATFELNGDCVNSYWHCVCESTLPGRFLACGSKAKRQESANNLLLVTREGTAEACQTFANSARSRS